MEHKILVVDDTRTDLELIASTLSNEFSTISASSPDEAIRILKENDIEFVIMDQMLPDMTGLALLQEMKKIKPEIEFLMITGMDSSTLAVKALKAGALDFITKPIEPFILIHKLKAGIIYAKSMKEQEKLRDQVQHDLQELEEYRKKYGPLQ